MEFDTLYSISPKQYNSLFSLPSNSNKKIMLKTKSTHFRDNSQKVKESIVFISANKNKDNKYSNSFNFYKTDIIPFPKFQGMTKTYKINKNKFIRTKIKKKENFFSVKYLQLIKDINNEKELKNYYFLKGNNKIKDIYDYRLKLMKIIFENDMETLTNGIVGLNEIKQNINNKNINTEKLIESIYNDDSKSNNLKTRNIFFREILNNINRQIEIYTNRNSKTDIILVKNLLCIELNKLENSFYELKKEIKKLIKENIIKNTIRFKKINNNNSSQISSSSLSSDDNNHKLFGKEYMKLFLKNKNKGGIKNFKKFFFENKLKKFEAIISSYNLIDDNYFYNKRTNKISKNDLTNFESNSYEPRYMVKRNKYSLFKNLPDDYIQSVSSQSKEIKGEINNSNEKREIYEYNYSRKNKNNNFTQTPINNSISNTKNNKTKINNSNMPNIKKNITAPLNYNIKKNEKFLSYNNINANQKNEKINSNVINNIDKIDKKSNNNISNLSKNINNENNNSNKNINNEKEIPNEIGTSFSMMKFFEEIMKNNKKNKNKKSQKNLDSIQNQNDENIEIEKKDEKNNPKFTEEYFDEVRKTKNEILKHKDSLVKRDETNKKSMRIDKKRFNEIQEKLVIMNNIHELGLKEKDKEELLKHIFIYKELLNKPDKTEEDIQKEQELKYKIKMFIEKFLYELQKSDLVNKKSIYSKKKKIIKKLHVFKKINIFEDEKLDKIEEEKIPKDIKSNNSRNNNDNKMKVANETHNEIKLEEKNYNKKKKELNLIYDNSYMFKKTKKKVEIKDEVLKILNTNYALVNESNINNTSTYNERPSFISSVNKIKNIKKKNLIKKKSTNRYFSSRRSSIFDEDVYENIEKMKFIEKKNEEDRLRREEEKRKKELELEEKRKRAELSERKLYDFFNKIQKMKNNEGDYESELEKLIDEKANNADSNKEIRLNSFIHKLSLYREKEKFYSKFQNKRLGFSSPLTFTMDNFYSKDKNIFRNNKLINEENLYKTEYNNNEN